MSEGCRLDLEDEQAGSSGETKDGTGRGRADKSGRSGSIEQAG